MRTIQALLAAIAMFFGTNAMSQQKVTVFQRGEEGYAAFRIPSVIKAADGDILAFAEGRRNGLSDTGDIDLVMKRSSDGGKTWSRLSVVWEDGTNVCGNPAPVVLPSGKIVMAMCWNYEKDKESQIERYQSKYPRKVFVISSEDNGFTWAKPMEITSSVKLSDWGWYATGPCHAIVKTKVPHKGRIIVSSNHSQFNAENQPESRSQFIYSDDEGKTWHIGAVTEVKGNESTVAELSDGSLLLNMRKSDPKDTVRLIAFSKDGGESIYEQRRATDLPEPQCQGSVVNRTRKNGKPTATLFFSNPADTKGRDHVSITRSDDNGKTWKLYKTVDSGGSAYSDLVLLDWSHLGVLYENWPDNDYYSKISFSVIEI